MTPENCGCLTNHVLDLVDDERARQFALHGANLENLSGTGPDVTWATPLAGYTTEGASVLEKALRAGYERSETMGQRVTWLQILLEEFSEVATEDSPERLVEELVQVAAVAVSWAEKLLDPDSAMNRK